MERRAKIFVFSRSVSVIVQPVVSIPQFNGAIGKGALLPETITHLYTHTHNTHTHTYILYIHTLVIVSVPHLSICNYLDTPLIAG